MVSIDIKMKKIPKGLTLLYKIIALPVALVAAIILLPFEIAGQCCVCCGAEPIDD